MTLISEEICANCIWQRFDSDGTIWCGNPESPDHMEDVKWNHSCDMWAMLEEAQNG